MDAVGYSTRPLVGKLGIKAGFRVLIVDPPPGYWELLGPLPAGVVIVPGADGPADFVQFFTREWAALEAQFPRLRGALVPAGLLWISWPKRAAGVPTDLDENRVRAAGLANGLVDVKVCAVDRTWSGLKFVYRLRDRGAAGARPADP